MTDHDRFLRFAATALDFELTSDEHAELETHLATCPTCRATATALSADRDALAALPRIDAPESVRQAVLAGGRSRAWRPALAVQALAIAVLAVPLALAVLALTNSDIGCGFCGSAGANGEGPPTITWQRLTVPPAPDAAALELHAVTQLAGGEIAVVGVACVDLDHARGCRAASAVSTDGSSWTHSAGDASLAVERLPDGSWAGMRAVSPGGPGLVAVGATGANGRPRAAAWLSSDGVNWDRVADGTGFSDAWMNSIIALADGTLLAAGGADTASGARAVAWTSADGRTWARAPDAPALDVGSADTFIAGRPAAGMWDVVAGSDGPIAVGGSCAPGQVTCSALAWISADGISWTPVPDSMLGDGTAAAATLIEPGLVAVGQRPSGAVTWRSTESGAWSVRALPPARSGGLLAATTLGKRAIAAGAAGSERSGIWATSDGLTWTFERSELFDAALVFGLTASADEVVAVGARGAERAVAWFGQEIAPEP